MLCYTIQCFVILGCCTICLFVDSVPGSPSNLQVIPLSITSIRVSWTAPPSLTDPVTHYKLYYYNVNDGAVEYDTTVTHTEYNVTGLLKFNTYGFRVVAHNKNGPGVSSDEVICRTYSDSKCIWCSCGNWWADLYSWVTKKQRYNTCVPCIVYWSRVLYCLFTSASEIIIAGLFVLSKWYFYQPPQSFTSYEVRGNSITQRFPYFSWSWPTWKYLGHLATHWMKWVLKIASWILSCSQNMPIYGQRLEISIFKTVNLNLGEQLKFIAMQCCN